ncbi:MAG TPA: hypothetical protein VF132_13715 [Rudaea sp.]
MDDEVEKPKGDAKRGRWRMTYPCRRIDPDASPAELRNKQPPYTIEDAIVENDAFRTNKGYARRISGTLIRARRQFPIARSVTALRRIAPSYRNLNFAFAEMADVPANYRSGFQRPLAMSNDARFRLSAE